MSQRMISLNSFQYAWLEKRDDFLNIINNLKCIGKLNAKGYNGRNLLHETCLHSKWDYLKLLIDAGADLEATSNMGLTALQITYSALKRTEGFKILLKAGANPNVIGKYKSTILHDLCDSDDLDNIDKDIRIFLKWKANPNLKNEYGQTPLHIVCAQGNTIHVEMLIKAGANLDVQDGNGNTPLYIACKNLHHMCIKSLLDAGANPNIKNGYGKTPVNIVMDFEILSMLLTAGADLNIKDNFGNTPLHNIFNAGQRMSKDIFEKLLYFTPDVNVTNDCGMTPLHIACRTNNPYAVCALLAFGANSNAQDMTGTTPLQCIPTYDRFDIDVMEVLLSAGADPNYQSRYCISFRYNMIQQKNVRALEFLDQYPFPLQHIVQFQLDNQEYRETLSLKMCE